MNSTDGARVAQLGLRRRALGFTRDVRPSHGGQATRTTCMLDALGALKATTGPGKIVVSIDFQNET
ncbi:MAG: hypothetical protein JNL79_05410 [Myxococcales bacterium]|nr:hypothetical protein [Myxococcales bacterium]